MNSGYRIKSINAMMILHNPIRKGKIEFDPQIGRLCVCDNIHPSLFEPADNPDNLGLYMQIKKAEDYLNKGYKESFKVVDFNDQELGTAGTLLEAIRVFKKRYPYMPKEYIHNFISNN